MDTELNNNNNNNNLDTDQQLQMMDTLWIQQQQQQQQSNHNQILSIDHLNEDSLLDEYEQSLDRLLIQEQNDKELLQQKLFQSFQTSACAVAQMFKDKSTTTSASTSTTANTTSTTTTTTTSTTNTTVPNNNNNNNNNNTLINNQWQSFQNAAGSITVLYKDSLDASKSNYELGVQHGQQRKLKELINWLRKKNSITNKRKTLIRKEELINFLIGKQQIPSNIFNNNNNNAYNIRFQQRQQQQQQQQQQNNSSTADLATFREALIMHNRTRDGCTLPNTNINQHQHTHHNINNIHHNNNHHTNTTSTQVQHTNCDDLDCFFCEQIATHIEHKRSSSSLQDMDSPTRKRSRFY